MREPPEPCAFPAPRRGLGFGLYRLPPAGLFAVLTRSLYGRHSTSFSVEWITFLLL